MARKPDEFSLTEPSGNSNDESGIGAIPGGDKDGVQRVVDGDKGAIDPASIPIGTEGTGQDTKRRRGRPKGSTSATKAGHSADIGAIQATLVSLHMIVATRIPEMKLEDAEAKMLAEAIARVEKYYPVVSSVITGRIADHVALVTALGAVYGTRIIAIQARLNEDRKAASATVIPINPAHSPFRTQ